jgi:hypothetical protein
MSKVMTASMMGKYEEILADYLEPLNSLIASKKRAYYFEVKGDVIREWGLSEMVSRKSLLEAELAELTNQLKVYLGEGYRTGTIEEETKRRISEIPSFKVFDDMEKVYKRYIRLCSAPTEVKEIFEKLDSELKNMLEQAQKLPGRLELLELKEDNDG